MLGSTRVQPYWMKPLRSMDVKAALLLALVAGHGTGLQAQPLPLQSAKPPPELHGAWQSNGYGWRLRIDDEGARFHHVVGALCWSAEEDDDFLSGADRFELSADGTKLRLYAIGEPHPYQFARLDAWPAHCDQPLSSAPQDRLARFVEVMASHYAFFDRYDVDWSARSKAAQAQLRPGSSDRRLYAAMRKALRGIDDAHLTLQAQVNGQPRQLEGNRGATLGRITARANAQGQRPGPERRRWQRMLWQAVLGEQRHEAGNGFLQWGWLDRDVGYIGAYTMGGYALADFSDPLADRQVLAEFLDQAVGAFADRPARAVVLDLSLNHGGYDFLARDIAARFADSRRLAYTKSPADADPPYATELWVEPAGGPRYGGPLYLLTSDITVSAGEIAVLALRPFPQVIHAGSPTRGALSDILGKNLGQGWSLNLSNEVYLDHAGLSWEGRGIPPALPIDVFPADDLDGGHAKAIVSLLRRIEQDLATEPSGPAGQ